MKNWSKYQSKIFAFIEDASAGNAVVEAVAGSGKSTTIVEGMNRIPAKIMGREIGQGLKSLITKLNAKGIDNLVLKLDVWADRESEKAIAKQQESRVEAIRDKAEAILCLIEGMLETERTIPALLAIIDSLFSDSKGKITLATIHKAKGLEADTVFWLNSSQCPAKWAKSDWQIQQENNLCYVAVTRAKQTLVLIEEQKRTVQ